MKQRLVRASLFAMLLTATPLLAEVSVPITRDLEADGKLAHERNLPILVMFYAEHCHYCTLVEESFLEPMLISGDYTDSVIIRRVDMEDHRPVTDFNGTAVAISDFAARYKVRVTPTLIYVDGDGKQVAEKMVGLTTIDYYGGYIDSRIETALDNLREKPVRAAAREIPGKNLD